MKAGDIFLGFYREKMVLKPRFGLMNITRTLDQKNQLLRSAKFKQGEVRFENNSSSRLLPTKIAKKDPT